MVSTRQTVNVECKPGYLHSRNVKVVVSLKFPRKVLHGRNSPVNDETSVDFASTIMIHLDRNRDSEQNSNIEDHSTTFNWVDQHHNYFANSLSHHQGQTIHPVPLPADDKSSSLSPPPEYNSPQIKRKPTPEPEPEPEQDDDGDGDGDGSYSRQLTPLTDLSAVPDGDDSLDFEKKEPTPEQDQNPDNPDNRWPEKHTVNGTSSPVRSIPSSPARHTIPIPVPGPSHRLATSAAPSHSRRPSREILSVSQLPSPNLQPAKLSDPSLGDPKVARILQINSELLKSVHTHFLHPQSHLLAF